MARTQGGGGFPRVARAGAASAGWAVGGAAFAGRAGGGAGGGAAFTGRFGTGMALDVTWCTLVFSGTELTVCGVGGCTGRKAGGTELTVCGFAGFTV